MLLALPFGTFGALLAVTLRGMTNDVYFQIGFLTTLGLSTKNAILIIQFAQDRLHHGEGLVEATLGAVKTRHKQLGLTPAILKKSFAVMEKALRGGTHLTREEMIAALGRARIATMEAKETTNAPPTT